MNHTINHESEFFDIYRAKAISANLNYYEAFLSAEIKESDLLKCIKNLSDTNKCKRVNFNYDDDNVFYPLTENVIFITDDTNDVTSFSCVCYVSYPPDSGDQKDAICGDIRFYGNIKYEKSITSSFTEILKYPYSDDDGNKFFVVATDGRGGLGLKKEKIDDINLDLELNYGKDFLKVYDKIFKGLKEQKAGLVLLYGPPGTGKTNLIRYLIKQLDNEKTIIYLPSFLMNDLANPEFIGFIRNQKDSILVLEDAEEVLTAREDNSNNQAVSNILNMTGGLLNDSLRIQIIATFNMEKKLIDKALLRPGRLICEHKFGSLKPEEATSLSKKLGINKIWDKDATLAEIYAGEVEITKRRKKRVGFKDEEDN